MMHETELSPPSSSAIAELTEEFPDRFLTSRELTAMGIGSKPTIDRYEQAGNFPKRIRLSHSRVVWRLREVLAWMDAKANERDSAAA